MIPWRWQREQQQALGCRAVHEDLLALTDGPSDAEGLSIPSSSEAVPD